MWLFYSYKRFFCVEYKKKFIQEKKLIETSDCLNASPFTLFLLQQENIFFWGKFMYKICREFILFVWEKVFLVYFMLVFNNNLLFKELYNLNFFINWFFVVTFFFVACLKPSFAQWTLWTVRFCQSQRLVDCIWQRIYVWPQMVFHHQLVKECSLKYSVSLFRLFSCIKIFSCVIFNISSTNVINTKPTGSSLHRSRCRSRMSHRSVSRFH